MKELIIKVQKQKGNIPDCNHIELNGENLGSIAGTAKMGTDPFDIEHGIVYFHNHDTYCGMLWNVTKIEVYKPQEVKA
jgi:hypothetical protein